MTEWEKFLRCFYNVETLCEATRTVIQLTKCRLFRPKNSLCVWHGWLYEKTVFENINMDPLGNLVNAIRSYITCLRRYKYRFK